MTTYKLNLEDVNWDELKARLAEDNFDNGRTAKQLGKSFKNSFAVCFAMDGDKIIDFEPGDTTAKKYGLAVDIGTTTVVCTVVDLNTGSDIGVASALNTQAVHGADVISRINYSVENEDGTATFN